MSFDAIRWAFAQPIPKSSAKFLLVAMADCVNEKEPDMVCWPSNVYLAERTGLDKKSVQTAIQWLVVHGYLVKTGAQRGRTKQVTEYLLKEPENGQVPMDQATAKGTQISPQSYPNSDSSADDESCRIAPSNEPESPPKDTQISPERYPNLDIFGDPESYPNFPSKVPVFPPKGTQISPERYPKTGNGTSKEPVIEPVMEPIKKSAREKSRFDPMSVQLPDWIPVDLWATWAKDRADRKKPITEAAAKLQLRKLAEMREKGQDPVAVIENAIANGWQGLYEIRDVGGHGVQRGARRSTHSGFDQMDYGEGIENGRIIL